jgi:ELWxxDGT repeat protein
MMVKLITTCPSALSNLTNVAGKFYFTYSNTLWRSDGTEAGTVPVRQLPRSAAFNTQDSPFTRWLQSVHDKLFFIHGDGGIDGWSLWESEGTSKGTRIADEINNDSGNNFVRDLFVTDDGLYVVATTEEHGAEVWTSALDAAYSAGDFDRDGHVDGRDFLVWQRSAGSVVNPPGSGAMGMGMASSMRRIWNCGGVRWASRASRGKTRRGRSGRLDGPSMNWLETRVPRSTPC